MKLVTFSINTVLGAFHRIGAIVNEHIIDLNQAYVQYLNEGGMTNRANALADVLIPADMIDFFKGGKLSREAAETAVNFANKKSAIDSQKANIIYPKDKVKLLAPVPKPNSIKDSVGFETHMKNYAQKMGEPVPKFWFERPIYYKGNTSSVIGMDEPIIWPSYGDKLDYELEFGIYIAKQGKDIKLDQAKEYIAGYTIFNDVSIRDEEIHQEVRLYSGPMKTKDFDTSNVMGPCLVTPDELVDVSNLDMIARINGEVWSKANTSDLYWTFPKVIEFVSRSETLYPGDFIASGTPAFGCGVELNKWIKPGDVIELEVEGIGILRNQVVKREKQ